MHSLVGRHAIFELNNLENGAYKENLMATAGRRCGQEKLKETRNGALRWGEGNDDICNSFVSHKTTNRPKKDVWTYNSYSEQEWPRKVYWISAKLSLRVPHAQVGNRWQPLQHFKTDTIWSATTKRVKSSSMCDSWCTHYAMYILPLPSYYSLV